MAHNSQDEFYGQQAREHDDTYDVKRVSNFIADGHGNLIRQTGNGSVETKQNAIIFLLQSILTTLDSTAFSCLGNETGESIIDESGNFLGY